MATSDLPARYRAFLENKEFAKYPKMGIAGLADWGDRTVPVTFLKKSSRSLLEENEVDLGEHPGLVPFATVGSEYSAFLLLDTADASCPIFLWDEGQFHSVAKSLDDFLARLKKKGAAPRSAPVVKACEKADALSSVGKHAAAVEVLDGVLEGIGPEVTPEATKEYVTAVSAALNSRGVALGDLGDRRALADLRAAAVWAECDFAYVDPSPALMNLVEVMAMKLGDHAQALERTQKILDQKLLLEAAKNDFYLHKVLGWCHLALGNVAKAEAEYEGLVKDDRKDEVASDLHDYVKRQLPHADVAARLVKKFE